MFRRLSIAGSLLIATALVLPVAAFGWSNGPYGDGLEGQGYGTHDWIVDQALESAGSGASWVNAEAARRSSDDPDTQSTDSAWHLFREKGISRGAPYKVGDLYEKAVAAYRGGDTYLASVYVGQLSHYYGDVLNPFHTTYDAISHESLHLKYELAVDNATRRPTDKPGWGQARTPVTVSDIRAKTVSAAYFSRSKYDSLLAAYSSSGSITNPTVNAITTSVLTRASTDLGDIIASIPHAAGIAPAPTSLDLSMSRNNVQKYAKAGAFVRVASASGAPMEGVGVELTWPLAGSTVRKIAYTDSNGYAQYYQNVGNLPLMKPRVLTAAASSAGSTVVDQTTFRATPRLKTGRAGVRTSVSTHHPKRKTVVKASTKCVSTSGKPVAGLKVTFYWKYKSGTVKTYGTTNAKGVAHTKMNIGKAAKGYRVAVLARVQSGGSNRSSKATFVPK